MCLLPDFIFECINKVAFIRAPQCILSIMLGVLPGMCNTLQSRMSMSGTGPSLSFLESAMTGGASDKNDAVECENALGIVPGSQRPFSTEFYDGSKPTMCGDR